MRLFLIFAVFITGCSPKLRMPYRDYVGENSLTIIQQSLVAKGFKIHKKHDAFQTDTLTTHKLGIYDLSTYFTMLPMAQQVRLQVHTLRKYKLSGRLTELPFIERHIYSRLIKPLETEIKQKGIRYDANF